MGTGRALGKTWVRAFLFVPTFLVVFFGLGLLGGYLFEHGHRGLGGTLAYLDWAGLLLAMLLGPAWILQAFSGPPRKGSPPGGGNGGNGPVPSDAPGGSGNVDVVGPTLGPLDEVDNGIRALLDQESLTSSTR